MMYGVEEAQWVNWTQSPPSGRAIPKPPGRRWQNCVGNATGQGFSGSSLDWVLIIATYFFGWFKQVSYTSMIDHVRQIAERKSILRVQKQVEDRSKYWLDVGLNFPMNLILEKVKVLFSISSGSYDTVKGRELAELWVDNVMALQFFIGSEQRLPRAWQTILARSIVHQFKCLLFLPGVSGVPLPRASWAVSCTFWGCDLL